MYTPPIDSVLDITRYLARRVDAGQKMFRQKHIYRLLRVIGKLEAEKRELERDVHFYVNKLAEYEEKTA